jgi:Na+/proline symporter
MVAALTAIIGYCILLGNTDPTHRPGVSYAGVFFAAAGIYPAVALTLSWPAVNVSGQTKRAVACGLQITIGNLGAVIGTQLYRNEDPPRYIVGHSVALGYLVGNIVVTGTIWLLLNSINKKRDAKAAQGNGEAWDGVWRGDKDERWRFTV